MKYKILDFICKSALVAHIYLCIKLMEYYITGPIVVEAPLWCIVVFFIAMNDLFLFKCFEDPRIIARRKKISRIINGQILKKTKIRNHGKRPK